MTAVALPHAPTAPLHIIDPVFLALTIAGAITLVLVVAGVVIWLLLWLRRRLVTTPAVMPPPPIRDMDERIARIREDHLASQEYRGGCHGLSALLKTYLEQQTRQPVEEMTPQEIRRRLENSLATGYFTMLAGLQFRRSAPGRSEFLNACEQSNRVARAFRRRP
ncbi:MAG: hypothetical protein JXQ27_09095 [Acidobacteria bacterium]|nr:hypothetical protein [Acidobacteriota bacterium]